jgi:hypothetical protein
MATQQVSITKIVERLRQLPSDKLDVVYDFVSYLLEKQQGALRGGRRAEAMETMIASETVLKRDWDTPEEDAAWADL